MIEEIIKECKFYLPLSENCNEILDGNGNEIYKCPKRQDCYYKQLKRLEQENKELKNIIKIHDCTKYDYYKLMKENEEWHIKYAGCNTANSAIQEQNKQLRSALEDIKEIAERYKDMEGCRIPLRAIKMIVDKVLTP